MEELTERIVALKGLTTLVALGILVALLSCLGLGSGLGLVQLVELKYGEEHQGWGWSDG